MMHSSNIHSTSMYVKRFLDEIEICQQVNRKFPFLSPSLKIPATAGFLMPHLP